MTLVPIRHPIAHDMCSPDARRHIVYFPYHLRLRQRTKDGERRASSDCPILNTDDVHFLGHDDLQLTLAPIATINELAIGLRDAPST